MSEHRPAEVGESVQRIEPARLETPPEAVADLAAELAAASAKLGRSLHPHTAAHLADLVRIMNSYYSNLIEGHDTRPRDIERALSDELDAEPERRNLQLEARAHIRVQEQIDQLHAKGQLGEPATPTFVAWVHEQFYADAPSDLTTIIDARGPRTIVPTMPAANKSLALAAIDKRLKLDLATRRDLAGALAEADSATVSVKAHRRVLLLSEGKGDEVYEPALRDRLVALSKARSSKDCPRC